MPAKCASGHATFVAGLKIFPLTVRSNLSLQKNKIESLRYLDPPRTSIECDNPIPQDISAYENCVMSFFREFG